MFDLMSMILSIIKLIIWIFTLIGTLFSAYQCILLFWPEKEYIIRYKITKPLKIVINRNLPITFSFYKSCDLNENIDKKVIYEELNSLFSSKNNILVSLDNSNIKIHFNERNFRF